MPTTTAIAKVCIVCGKDVSSAKRVKNSKGEYFCQPCADRLREAKTAVAPTELAPPKPQPGITDTVDDPVTAKTAVAVGNVVRHISRLWNLRWGRVAFVGGGIITVTLIALVWYGSKYDAAQRDFLYKRADESKDMYDRMAESSGRQAEKARQEAASLHAQAEALRGGSNPDTSDGSSQQTKSEAIAGDPYISGVVGQYPELQSRIQRGGLDLDTHLDLMVAQGKLSPSDVQNIRSFSSNIQNLRD